MVGCFRFWLGATGDRLGIAVTGRRGGKELAPLLVFSWRIPRSARMSRDCENVFSRCGAFAAGRTLCRMMVRLSLEFFGARLLFMMNRGRAVISALANGLPRTTTIYQPRGRSP